MSMCPNQRVIWASFLTDKFETAYAIKAFFKPEQGNGSLRRTWVANRKCKIQC